MLTFAIDLSDTIREFTLIPEEIDSMCDYVLDRTVDEIMMKWMDLVNGELHTTRDEYKRAMYSDRPDTRTAIIGLAARDSKLAMMIEVGAEAFDEKTGFANSDKKRLTKEGWYLTIPFRHAISESIMGMDVPGMDTTVLDLMRTGATIGPEELPAPHDEILTHELKLNTGTLISYKHKAPIYAGMHRRNIASTMNEKRGGYFTFRRVSNNSDEQAWIHPGFRPHAFMDRALQQMEAGAVVDAAVQEWLDRKFD